MEVYLLILEKISVILVFTSFYDVDCCYNVLYCVVAIYVFNDCTESLISCTLSQL